MADLRRPAAASRHRGKSGSPAPNPVLSKTPELTIVLQAHQDLVYRDNDHVITTEAFA